MYQFIKNVYFRKLKFIFKTYDLTTTFQETWKYRASHNIRSLKDLISHFRQSSEHIRTIFDREMSGFVVYIILNQVRTPKEMSIGENLNTVCRNFLGLPVVYAGYTRYDEAVQKNINNKEPFMLYNRLSSVFGEVKGVTENIAAAENLAV
jgi:MinD-like ATPase involved in chromosome partitioning or flagellar assembly